MSRAATDSDEAVSHAAACVLYPSIPEHLDYHSARQFGSVSLWNAAALSAWRPKRGPRFRAFESKFSVLAEVRTMRMDFAKRNVNGFVSVLRKYYFDLETCVLALSRSHHRLPFF